jgi:hypothetical protein
MRASESLDDGPRRLQLPSYTSGVDLQTMWAHFLVPIDVIVSG